MDEIETFEKFRRELIDELDYVKMKMKQMRSMRSSSDKDSEEEKRSGSARSKEENRISGNNETNWNTRFLDGRFIEGDENRDCRKE